jgi:hypothetical protein
MFVNLILNDSIYLIINNKLAFCFNQLINFVYLYIIIKKNVNI